MRQEERDVYVIPPNFIEGGTLMGGLIRTRNAIEAGVLGVLTALPVLRLNLSLTARVIILCLTTLPLVLAALIGIGGQSLSQFILQFILWLRNRRVLNRSGAGAKKGLLPSWAQRVQPTEPEVEELPKSRNRFRVDVKKREVSQHKTFLEPEAAVKPLNPLAEYVPIEKITHGVIKTRDRRYVKVVEVVPVNFLLRSSQEQRNIIYSFISYLKIAPGKVQFKVLTKRADIDRHVDGVREELARETDPHCRMLQEDYLKLIRDLGSREAITRRFFLIFEHEPTVTADSVEELEWKCAEMKKLLLSQDMNVQPCFFCQEQAFLSSLPLVSLEKHLFERSKRNVLTLGAASCYPYTSYEMCDDNGILLGVNKHNNSLIIVDIFDSNVYKNANIAILGTSGAGKSFTMQLMATRMRRKGIQVFIVAPLKGHEFHRACSNIGGEFIQISPASPNCINVMEIRKVDKSVDELLDGPGVEKSLLAAKIQRLHIFFSLLIPDMTHEERQLLDDALIRTYASLDITHDNASLDNPERPGRYRTMPVLGDLYDTLKEVPDTRRLANIINRLVHGSAKTFNQQTNVSLDNKYTVLDISELTGDLLTVGMFVALDYVWDKAKENRTEEKAIFIDECWQLIGANSNRLAAEFVLEIFKIIRGYGGSAICATQDINDFFALEDGKYGKGIINNAKTKILLNLEDEEARRVQSLLHLSEAEVMEITHFERGSGLISTNNNNVTVEIKCSQLEKELITTDRRELQELLARQAG